MTNHRLTGKYVPDKDGKLRPTLIFTETNSNMLTLASRHANHSSIFGAIPSWYKKVRLWVKNMGSGFTL